MSECGENHVKKNLFLVVSNVSSEEMMTDKDDDG